MTPNQEPGHESEPSVRWPVRDDFFKDFYGEVYKEGLDEDDIETYLNSKNKTAYLTLEQRAPTLAKLEAAGLNQTNVHDRITEMIKDLEDEEKEALDYLVGLSRHNVPTSIEAVQHLDLSREQLELLIEVLRQKILSDKKE